ncbi:hypothetical protein [uncultured Adlercreutzia sp.]|uniref:hypothetical protein n=1 Tax=uncultured Adlercreutzia sp. TaxID=875803 RepID=UPI002583378E|nr:hypothetical protein [uncultured Adlercreutzia sp.]
MNELSQRINSIIERRRQLQPDVEAARKSVEQKLKQIDSVVQSTEILLRFSDKIDEEHSVNLATALDELKESKEHLENLQVDLDNLEKRYRRNTINIGVSGEARVGKSTTLQSFSGLTDIQIPTGKGLPVTAVRSEIFNATDEFAEIEFRDVQSFIDEYIAPHVLNINDAGGLHLQIASLADLRNATIPSTLGNNINSVASDSLRKLQAAQASLGSYASLLTGEKKRVPLDEVRKYVAYPTDDEKQSGGNVERAYLAVCGVKIYCRFPSLADEQIGLIDLPGLGEIGDSVAKIHTSGLENEVDQVLLVMKPTDTKGFADAGIVQNVDQLRKIQRGISKRGDLIVAAINNDETNAESAKSLRHDFDEAINASQNDDIIEIRDFVAIDPLSVTDLFSFLLDKLTESLPSMDRDPYAYVMETNFGSIDQEIGILFKRIDSIATEILKTIPLEDSLLDQLADEVSRDLIYEYEDLEEAKFSSADKSNPQRASLEQQVAFIHDNNVDRINDGLFLAGTEAWKRHARGRSDYVSFLRSEARRVKAEIIDSYREVDVFYDSSINELRGQVVRIFYKNTGRLYELIGVDPSDSVTAESIERLVNTLDSKVRDEDFTHCFRFISEVSFKFSQNVFYNIYSSMEEMHNPKVDTSIERRGISLEERTEATHRELCRMALKANADIKSKILDHTDVFNQFLFTCMTFFNDFLYRKDDKRFERDVRILLKECRDYMIPEGRIKIDTDMQMSIRALKAALSGASIDIPTIEPPKPYKWKHANFDQTKPKTTPKPDVESRPSEHKPSRKTAKQAASLQPKTMADKNSGGYRSSFGQEW